MSRETAFQAQDCDTAHHMSHNSPGVLMQSCCSKLLSVKLYTTRETQQVEEWSDVLPEGKEDRLELIPANSWDV